MIQTKDIDNFLTNLRVDDFIPGEAQDRVHYFADYFELVALFSKDFLTSGEMLDRLKDAGFWVQKKRDSDQAEANDEQENFVKSIFKILEERAYLYDEDYAFTCQGGYFRLKDDLSLRNRLYLQLLISSNLDVFKQFTGDITQEFEQLSVIALKNYLPSHAIVKPLGKQSAFHGYARDKVKQLAKEMKVEVDEEFIETTSPKGTQDLGGDLAAWVPFPDDVGNYISVFGQCACGKNWPHKLSETKQYNRFLRMYLNKISHALFIPYSLIDYQKSKFFEHHCFGENILVFERKRILSLITDESVVTSLETQKIVEECIVFEEGIV